ncbi:type II CRISPR-associated endonuclease Cas1 [Falsiporphyromonas endometrii]|uniref:CRISPR-associated endonuclease Cas1 n=1 Tax=Falsiporphyromonas endometrii TaxID=1387297 RepID=A0ABV9K809_9PORP
MVKKVLCLSHPAYLSFKKGLLIIELPEIKETANLPQRLKEKGVITRPIEDIAMVILDHRRITITSAAMEGLLMGNVAIVSCAANGLPLGLHMPLNTNTLQSERFRHQIKASEPLKKQLWQQTIRQKIDNQAAVLERYTDAPTGCMKRWAEDVKSGDTTNVEAKAAVYYWKYLFEEIPDFKREREGIYPNNLLNYGYAILRAAVARALIGSGLLPTMGIHHHNRYNAYCLADDVMEPYRPYVDKLVVSMVRESAEVQLVKDTKAKLLGVLTKDVKMDNKIYPLMIATQMTSASIYKCFCGEVRKILYPEL